MCNKGHVPWNKGKRSIKLCVICSNETRRAKNRCYRKTCSLVCENKLRSKIKIEQGIVPPSRRGTGKNIIKKVFAKYEQILFPTGYRVYVHRRVMEKYLKRKLFSFEQVHHINGDKLDNRIENLMVLSISEHAKLHKKLRNMRGQYTGNIMI
jgi:hypothetical protein